eukprot:CAMPEP_0206448620 /NCGR_PEP_ID=MMETSP0324_2-20121206/17580_1 /ASSEMBLY_ACC=CAM_ASM_000836 /TAXON_ID=2866 /ORGANISM="Crypthecodinium cohnii, Strain Seligo" /LENGTH=86 /DNA_ID=CAMNT_0053917797 /DNA_START=58 /DNA_END=315 /DNA_ORIENTATION=+
MRHPRGKHAVHLPTNRKQACWWQCWPAQQLLPDVEGGGEMKIHDQDGHRRENELGNTEDAGGRTLGASSVSGQSKTGGAYGLAFLS